MDAEDWLKSVKKKLEIAQCTNREKVLFMVHQLFGTVADWWETNCNTHANVEAICHTPVLGNRTKASIRVPRMFKSHVRPTIW
jgi:hypothetical protein